MECRQTSRNAVSCACGSLLYEDARGFVYCVRSHELIWEPARGHNQFEEPKHVTSCHRDEDDVWHCKEFCPVRKAQVGMFS